MSTFMSVAPSARLIRVCREPLTIPDEPDLVLRLGGVVHHHEVGVHGALNLLVRLAGELLDEGVEAFAELGGLLLWNATVRDNADRADMRRVVEAFLLKQVGPARPQGLLIVQEELVDDGT